MRSLLLLVVAFVGEVYWAEGATTFRGAVSSDDGSCQSCKDHKSCVGSTDKDTNEPCYWCGAAIPSECLRESQAKGLPSGVFTCASKAKGQGEKYDREEAKDGVLLTTTVFSFVPDKTHVLTDGPVDGELCDPSSLSLSGYMDVKGSKYDTVQDKHLFFWFFEQRKPTRKAEEIPFIVWLAGGPGCSSAIALLKENGPCFLESDGESTKVNPYSWTEAAHVLWLDQPAGVGYSYGAKEDDKNEEMVGEDTYYFFQSFFKSHPQYANNPFFVVGESYGGHYAPSIAHRILVGNQALTEGDDLIKINLQGLGIGNGLTNPELQYPWYPEMAYHNSHHLRVVSESTYETMKKAVPICVKAIAECNRDNSLVSAAACETAYVYCNGALMTPDELMGINPYDIRQKCEGFLDNHPRCYDFSDLEKWLDNPATRDALHVSSHAHPNWKSSNRAINAAFRGDWMKDSSPLVKDLLNSGQVRVLIYAGDVDYACNYLGNRAWTLALEWDHKDEFNAAEDHEWNKGGLARTANDFTFLQVYDAGHLVPSDQPKVALDMITNFVNGGEF